MLNEANDLKPANTLQTTANPPVSEYGNAEEFGSVSTAPKIREFPDVRASGVPHRKKKSKWDTFLFSSAVAVAVVVFEVAEILPASNVTVFDYHISATDTSVFYEIEFENYTSGDEIEIELYNNFTSRKQKVSDHFAVGDEHDLKPDMTYTLEVRSGFRTILKETVHTEPYMEPPDEPEIPEPPVDPETSVPQVVDVKVEASEDMAFFDAILENLSEDTDVFAELLDENGDVLDSRMITESPAMGDFHDLNADTEYTFRIRSGEEIIYVEKVRTMAAEFRVSNANFYPEENMIRYDVGLDHIELAESVIITLLQDEEIIQSAELPESWNTGEFTDLMDSTVYTVQISNGDEIIYTETVMTAAPSLSIYNADFIASGNTISYNVELNNFDLAQNPMVVLLLNGSVISSESIQKSAVNGIFEELEYQTDYTVEIRNAGEVIYTQEITTEIQP